MVRAPCCEKMGVKKGPWSNEEDRILISYVTKYGHPNWRALPKLAGLQRCGKSCRLRWINYLQPDIKRGNFSEEEEEAIINLHKLLGNKWSAIAARLPGRTDNEIKNVWHTHLKKRLNQDSKNSKSPKIPKLEYSTSVTQPEINKSCHAPFSAQPSTSELSSVTDSSVKTVEKDALLEIDEFFLETEVYGENSTPLDSSINDELGFESKSSDFGNILKGDDEMEFWYELFMRAEELPELTWF